MTPEVRNIVLSLMAGLDCPRSLQVKLLVENEEWDQLTQLEVNPLHHNDSDSYLRAAVASDLLRKYDGFDLDIDLESMAIEKWSWAEKMCFNTNRKFNEFMDFGTINGAVPHDRILEFLEDLRKCTRWLLGDGPPQTFRGYFGPGATISDMSEYTTVPNKMSTVPTFTPSAVFYLVPWTGTKWAQACAARGDACLSVRGNMYFTVNKHSRAKRSCAKEASINGFYQLGLGRQMRSRLKHRGINLEDGQLVHRQVACAASITGESCTIDLTSASDCKAYALVKYALPPAWFEPADDLRSSYTGFKQPGGKVKWVKLEKFSSMGNGYTFELETAIFTAICMAATRCQLTPGIDLFVYGDDIICPTEYYDDILVALRFCGFTPNLSKTHGTGYFRESCGGDFFNGKAVRPHFIKEVIYEPQQLISLANGIRRVGHLSGFNPGAWRSLVRSWHKCLDLLPTNIRACRGPEGLGDLCIWDDEERWAIRWRDLPLTHKPRDSTGELCKRDKSLWATRWSDSRIRWVKVYRPARWFGYRFDRFDPEIQFAAALYGVALKQIETPWIGHDNRSVLPRESVLGYKVGWVPFS